MKSKTMIKVDLARSSYGPWVEAIQGDGGTRCISVQLLDNGKPWLPPENTQIAIVYTQPGGTKGLYDKLPDGRKAISVNGNTITAILAPKMLSVPGEVHAAIVFNNSQLDQLTTFPFSVMVAKNQFAGAQEVEDYIRLQWLEEKLAEKIDELISTEQAVRAGVAAQEATAAAAAAQEKAAVAENAAEAANTAAASAQAVVDGIVPEVNQLKSDLAAITPDDATIDGKPWTSRKIVDSLCQPFEETGNPVQCYPVENYPLGIKVRIEPKQEGSGDPSPENVRPIVGVNTLSMTQCGKNLLNPANMSKTVTQNGFTAEQLSDGRYHIYGTSDNNDAYINLLHGSNFPAFQANTPYTITLLGSNQLSPNIFLRIDGAWVNKPVSQTANSKTYVFDRVDFDLVLIRVSAKGSGIEIDDIISAQITIGTEVQTSYEPYCGDTYHISLPETVYGGELDVETGVLTVTHGAIISYAGEALPGKWISDRDIFSGGAVPTTGAQVVYELSQPYTIQLTPRQITALSGVNAIYTDADGVIVTGREDPQHTIESLLIQLGG